MHKHGHIFFVVFNHKKSCKYFLRLQFSWSYDLRLHIKRDLVSNHCNINRSLTGSKHTRNRTAFCVKGLLWWGVKGYSSNNRDFCLRAKLCRRSIKSKLWVQSFKQTGEYWSYQRVQMELSESVEMMLCVCVYVCVCLCACMHVCVYMCLCVCVWGRTHAWECCLSG